MDLLQTECALQHRLQDCLHHNLGVHCVPHAERLQTDPRPQPGHIQSPVPLGSKRSARDTFPIRIQIF
jgi:hypothetical protein